MNPKNPNSDNMNTPKLRFKEFTDVWKKAKLESLLISYRLGGNYENSEAETGIPLIKMGNLGRGSIVLDKIQYVSSNEILDDKDQIKFGDLFFNTRNTLELVGKVAIWRNELPIAYYNSNLMYLKFKDNFFMNYRLNSFQGIKALRRLATGTTSVAAIYTKDLLHVKVFVPSPPEQQKIASFLSAVDEKIQQLTRKKELLQHYKKGVMQQLFSGKLRFKQPNGKSYPKWEEKRLGEVAGRVVRKNKENNPNVLTISAQMGLVSQLEYFNKNVASKDVTNYYLIERDEFAYNKSYSAGYPMGAIKRLIRYDKGVVSTLYICFRFKEDVSLEFMEQYFEMGKQNIEIEKVAQEGARNHGLLNIGVGDFFNILLSLPSLEEQQKIASLLSAIDAKIEGVANQITKAQTFKKGLLQQMFV